MQYITTLPRCIIRLRGTEFINIKEESQEKSAIKLNDLLSFLGEHRDKSPKQRANSIHYLSRWFKLLGHCESSIYLLNKLKSYGIIIGGKSLSASQQKMLRKAKDKGVNL